MTFIQRHIGPRTRDIDDIMLGAVGYASVDELATRAIPASIVDPTALDLPPALSEVEVEQVLRSFAERNIVLDSAIGQGYHDTITPPVLRRGVLQNAGWYTSYTPYQAEISQGRLEVLLTFQQMVQDLTGLPVANASLLDEATAAAEAVALIVRAQRGRGRVLVDSALHPQVLSVVHSRAHAADLNVDVVDIEDLEVPDDIAGAVFAQIATTGEIRDLTGPVRAVQAAGGKVAVDCDLLALTLLTEPGALGADIAFGSAQRFGVPLFFGGPHAAFMAVDRGLQRMLPGRLVGVSVDADGQTGYRLALQTREQHIRREKATSNICTAQALLAIMAALYAAWHGPDGLRDIACRVHSLAEKLAAQLTAAGLAVRPGPRFDTVTVDGVDAEAIRARAEEQGVNLRVVDASTVSVSFGESHDDALVARIVAAFGVPASDVPETNAWWPEALQRTSAYLTHPFFHRYRSETAMMRWLRELADRDLALDRTMIPLGSCTMKLNAVSEMEAITWPEFANIHPFAPEHQTVGWRELIAELERRLVEITGYDAASLQPNAGSQGEFAGLLAIRAHHEARGEGGRRVCLIPASAHGTNAASAVLAGMTVVVVATADDGSIDLDDLRAKIDMHRDELAAIMITYPSTHGVFEADVSTVCELVHEAGGQVYIDGANLNALVGWARPGRFGGDVSHLNLHKTFCIPHGGGGPGVGPIVVREHLAPYLPGDATDADAVAGTRTTALPVSAALYGSAGVLPISFAYIAMMGADGLKEATGTALLNANYLAVKLRDAFPVLYTGEDGLVAHECILDLRDLTQRSGVTAEDVAKRLIDYGFHAPTLAFPVAGTLMVEPTESEPLEELDRFVEAMLAIRAEIDRVIAGEWTVEQSPLRQAPHTATCLVGEWELPYTREEAVFPVPSLRRAKYFPPVRRVDGAHGDRNFICDCPPMDDYR